MENEKIPAGIIRRVTYVHRLNVLIGDEILIEELFNGVFLNQRNILAQFIKIQRIF